MRGGIGMFVRVFQGKVRDAYLLTRQYETWRMSIKPKTTGYLGSTTGVTADGDIYHRPLRVRGDGSSR